MPTRFANPVQIGGVAGALVGSALDVSNGLFNMRRQAITLVNGSNDNLTLPTSSFVEFTGPTAAFNITGIAGGVDGAIINFLYLGTQLFALTHQQTSVAANQIYNPTGTHEATIGPCAGTLQYNSNLARWVIVNMKYGGYRPNSLLTRSTFTTAVSGIGTGGYDFADTASVMIPSGRRLRLSGHIYVSGQGGNPGLYAVMKMDGAIVGDRWGQFNAIPGTSPAMILSGETRIDSTISGNHVFRMSVVSIGTGTITVNDPSAASWIEVWDAGAT